MELYRDQLALALPSRRINGISVGIGTYQAEVGAEHRRLNVEVERLRASVDECQARVDRTKAELQQAYRELHRMGGVMEFVRNERQTFGQ